MSTPAEELPDNRLSLATATAAAAIVPPAGPDADDDPSASQVVARGAIDPSAAPTAPDDDDTPLPLDYQSKAAPREADSLAPRAFRGGLVTLAAQGVKFTLHMTSVAVFARLLAPAEHGLVNMTTAFTGFALLFKDLGLGTATVQAKTVDQRQLTAIFWMMVTISLVSMATMIGLSPIIANRFYEEPKVMPIMCGLSISLLFGGLAAQHQAILRRNMKFKALATIDVSAMAFGVVCGIIAAELSLGSWSLVIMVVAQAFAVAAMSWWVSDWRPSLSFSLRGTREMIRFGGFMTGFNILNYCVRNIDNIIIAKIYGPVTGPLMLGLYSKAYQLLVLPINQLTAPIGNVAHPALCRLHGAGQDARWRRYYLNALTMVAALTTPVVMFSFAMAHQVIVVLLGERWVEAVPLYRALAGAALVDTVNVASGWAFMSTGRTDRMFYWQVFETFATLAAFAIGAYIGISTGAGAAMGIAVAFSLVRATLRIPLLIYCFRTAPVTLGQTLWSLRLPFGASLVAAVVVAAVSHFGYARIASPLLQLLLGFTLFVPVYGLCWLAVPSGRALLAEAAALIHLSFFNKRLRRSN